VESLQRLFTCRDVLKLTVPFLWTIASVIACLAYLGTQRWSSAFFAFVSGFVAVIVLVDIWQFHRTVNYVQLEREQQRKTEVTWKLLCAVFITTGTFFAFLVSCFLQQQVQVFGWNNIAWTFLAFVMGLTWTIDIAKYHLNTSSQPQNRAAAAVAETESHEVDLEDVSL